MNERIRELAEQAKEETDALWAKLTPQEFKDTYNQKFAELIVQECANIAYNKQYKHSSAHTRGDCADAIKEHFGVEE